MNSRDQSALKVSDWKNMMENLGTIVQSSIFTLTDRFWIIQIQTFLIKCSERKKKIELVGLESMVSRKTPGQCLSHCPSGLHTGPVLWFVYNLVLNEILL